MEWIRPGWTREVQPGDRGHWTGRHEGVEWIRPGWTRQVQPGDRGHWTDRHEATSAGARASLRQHFGADRRPQITETSFVLVL